MSVIVIDPYEIPNANVYARILLVGGGGGGSSGGGGAGGFLDIIAPIYKGYVYTVTVGIGGARGVVTNAGTATAQAQPGTDGGNTVFSGNGVNIIAHGGGGGGGWYYVYPGSNTIYQGRPGGSAGGAGASIDGSLTDRGPFRGGATVEYVTYNGNLGGDGNLTFVGAGGGGGASESGYAANGYSATLGGWDPFVSNRRGKGGNGKNSDISGTLTTYGGGGFGAGGNGDQASGGGGGGVGSGGVNDGTNGLGGGGGGRVFRTDSTTAPGRGGSGILIISYPGSQLWSGGTVTTVGSNTVHTFTANGTLTPL